jgi:hypothetical protein
MTPKVERLTPESALGDHEDRIRILERVDHGGVP